VPENGILKRPIEPAYCNDILKRHLENILKRQLENGPLKWYLDPSRFNAAADKLAKDAARLEAELEAAQVASPTVPTVVPSYCTIPHTIPYCTSKDSNVFFHF